MKYLICLAILLVTINSSRNETGNVGKDSSSRAQSQETTGETNQGLNNQEVKPNCPSSKKCEELNYPCINCTMNTSCEYGKSTEVKCSALVDCIGSKDFDRNATCQYCYQSFEDEHSCVLKANCNSVSSPKSYYRTNCTVRDDVICLGRRTFVKNLPCNWTGGHRWSTALFLSITLGGFGADRFYLGYWQEGIGKLFSFGGLGVWTIIDFILIVIQYLGPADGSLYI